MVYMYMYAYVYVYGLHCDYIDPRSLILTFESMTMSCLSYSLFSISLSLSRVYPVSASLT